MHRELAVNELPIRNLAPLPPTRLTRGQIPPTNRWYSGLVFGSPHPVFPMPLSYMQTGQGFVFGVPRVTTSRHTISGPAVTDIDVNVGATSYRVSSSDLASITIDMLNASGRVLGKVVLAEGVPYVSYTAEIAHDVVMSESFSWRFENCATATVEGRAYGLVTTGAFAARTVRLAAGQFVSFIGFPHEPAPGRTVEETITRLATHAAYPVQRTEVTASVHDTHVATAVRYIARENGPVAVVRMPHHGPTTDDVLGHYSTVSGTTTLTSAKNFTWVTPRPREASAHPLTSVPAADVDELITLITADINEPPRAPTDTYYAGKALYAQANLVTLAERFQVVGAAEYRTQVEANLVRWLHPDGAQRYDHRFFAYDDQWKGVIGVDASFGADEFNDHHVHYGYFIHAAATLAHHHRDLVPVMAPVINALIADIAHHKTSAVVPLLRAVDVYKGHSWASGTAPFDEGNNQQSVCEALNTWNALAAWATVTDDQELFDLATWLLALETQSAATYWLNIDRDDPVRRGYKHPIVPLVWGAKHDYATWFNGEPSGLLGTMLLPMPTPVAHVAADADRIAENLDDVLGYYQDFDTEHGDYLLMYQALAGQEQAGHALETVRALPEDRIDDGNSRSWLFAWVAAHTKVN